MARLLTPAYALPAPFPISQMQSFALDFKTAGSNGTASIEFGGIDHSKYEGQLARAPLNSTDGHWAVDNVDFSFDNLRMNTSTHVILGAYHSLHPITDQMPRLNGCCTLQIQAQDPTSVPRKQSPKPITVGCREPSSTTGFLITLHCGPSLQTPNHD